MAQNRFQQDAASARQLLSQCGASIFHERHQKVVDLFEFELRPFVRDAPNRRPPTQFDQVCLAPCCLIEAVAIPPIAVVRNHEHLCEQATFGIEQLHDPVEVGHVHRGEYIVQDQNVS